MEREREKKRVKWRRTRRLLTPEQRGNGGGGGFGCGMRRKWRGPGHSTGEREQGGLASGGWGSRPLLGAAPGASDVRGRPSGARQAPRVAPDRGGRGEADG
jgi:hypothetical protein